VTHPQDENIVSSTAHTCPPGHEYPPQPVSQGAGTAHRQNWIEKLGAVNGWHSAPVTQVPPHVG
jgi:hypothetical protein